MDFIQATNADHEEQLCLWLHVESSLGLGGTLEANSILLLCIAHHQHMVIHCHLDSSEPQKKCSSAHLLQEVLDVLLSLLEDSGAASLGLLLRLGCGSSLICRPLLVPLSLLGKQLCS
jgi:hypothetical protein